jgi:hypothetical protein
MKIVGFEKKKKKKKKTTVIMTRSIKERWLDEINGTIEIEIASLRWR